MTHVGHGQWIGGVRLAIIVGASLHHLSGRPRIRKEFFDA
jgi:hypothetical protein